MADLDPYSNLLAKIFVQWNKAEEAIKLAEQINSKVVFPSVKELRYAGRRIIDALEKIASGVSGQEIEITNLLQDAEYDCYSARHDAIDAATAKIALDLENAATKLGYDAILKAYPNYSELNDPLDTVREKIVATRKDRANRETIYSVLESIDLPALVEKFREFQKSEPIMVALARKARRQNAMGVIGAVAGVVGVVIAIVTLVLK